LGLIGKGAKPLAGGMSLIPMMKLRLSAPNIWSTLVAFRNLRRFAKSKGAIHVGAMATHHTVESSPIIRGKCPLLGETVSAIGDVQVRNMGNHRGQHRACGSGGGLPGGAAGARSSHRHFESRARLPRRLFSSTLFRPRLRKARIILKVIVPVEDSGAGTSYQKMPHPASGFAIIGVAARIRKSGGKITMARIGVTGLANKSYRATMTENLLEGKAGY
jgi:carbon-monoxide dehydrogenase medium subunit